MPECPEVTILSDYLKDEVLNHFISTIEIKSGKYLNKKLVGKDLLNGSIKYKVVDVNSKGKVLYMTLKHNTTTIYFVSHLGMAGEWSKMESDSDRIRLTVTSQNNDEFKLCYRDPRNFGNIEILNPTEFEKRINKLAPDVLKTDFSDEDFCNMVANFLKKSKKRSSQLIFKVLTKQNLSDGIFSGLGNYLIPEILYDAKLSPYRQIGGLSKDELLTLSHSIKYITKLSYYNNITGYMTNFGDYSEKHKKGIDDGTYQNYHNDIKLKHTDKFSFNIYQKKKDPLGNPVEKDKVLNKGRTTHWVKNVQV
jgi:formamidopyrimidine-DNA glycosylase